MTIALCRVAVMHPNHRKLHYENVNTDKTRLNNNALGSLR